MRKLIAIAAALGFLGATSLTPVFAAPAGNGMTATDFSAQAKKKKAKKSSKKKPAKKMEKKSSLTVTDISAQEKKAAKKKAKKSSKKKPAKMEKKSGVILYQIAA
ncbi:MAG: hypothetical protein GEU91_20285 [Rhizobiales bacterium]|nr:hypothetical protein [Hyphomicrobiales bacterium]